MQVMAILHTGLFHDKLLHLLSVYPHRYSIQRQPETIVKQSPSRDNNDNSNAKSDNRVNNAPSCIGDNNARNNYTDRHQCICCHMQVSSFHIQILIFIFHKEPGSQCVDDHSHPGCPCDGRTIYGNRVEEFIYTLGNNNAHGNQ